MPPRIRVRIPAHQTSAQTTRGPRCHNGLILSCRYASAAATTPAATPEQMTSSNSPVQRYPSSQFPSHRRPEFRKSQLHRQYTSLLRTTPLMLLFQHNNLQSTEWAGIRRELSRALQKVDENHAAAGRTEPPLASSIKIQIIQTGIFEAALRVVEYFQPNDALAARTPHATDPSTSTSAEIPNVRGTPAELAFTHDLSRAAHDATLKMKGKHDLSTLLMGPIAVLTFPQVSPEHLKAALSILSPKAPMFPAPPRKLNPGYYDLTVQSGLQKLMLLAARVEGKVFDLDETRWVGGIEGGMGGLRSQLVYALQSMGAGVTGALEGASKSLYLTMESRRSVLEEEQKGGEEKKADS